MTEKGPRKMEIVFFFGSQRERKKTFMGNVSASPILLCRGKTDDDYESKVERIHFFGLLVATLHVIQAYDAAHSPGCGPLRPGSGPEHPDMLEPTRCAGRTHFKINATANDSIAVFSVKISGNDLKSDQRAHKYQGRKENYIDVLFWNYIWVPFLYIWQQLRYKHR